MSRTLLVVSCAHIGAKEFAEEEFKGYIKTAQAGKWDVAFIGDLVNLGLQYGTRHLNSIFEDKLKPQEQVDKFVELTQPIKNQIICVLRGNHDDRAYNICGLKVAKLIADQLNAPYYDALKLLDWNGYKIFLAHGTSSSDSEFDKIIKTYDSLDAIILGHSHEWKYKVKRKYRSSGKTELVHCVRAGSFLDYSDYAKRALYEPQPIGSPIIKAHDEGLEVKFGLASI